MAKPVKVGPGGYSPEGGRLRVDYVVRCREGEDATKALLEIFLPLPDEADVELASHVDAVRLPAFLELVEALKEWQKADGRIR